MRAHGLRAFLGLVILFLGACSGAARPAGEWGYAYFAPWYPQFTVVEWDQRGAGRTLRKSGPSIAPTITLDRLVDDGIELSDYLRKHLGKEKIFIVGHSFGSTIGTLMARARPDLFFAYVIVKCVSGRDGIFPRGARWAGSPRASHN